MNEYLKKAQENHCDLLYSWANDKLARQSSFNQDKIIYSDHVKWFHSKLISSNCDIYILYVDATPVGHVRIDIKDKSAIISYCIDKNYRGYGLATKMIQLLEEEVKSKFNNINTLVGYVKFENVNSQRIFEKLGYKKINNKNCLKYYKNL